MTGPRIPESQPPTEYFAALERATPIVQADGDVPTTTSMRVANGTGVQHKNVLELIGNNAADFAEFGPVAFETRPHPTQVGAMQRIAILNEEHATLLLTYMRNNDVVRDFKKRLVREFSALRRATATPPARPLPQTYAAALRELATEVEARELAEARARDGGAAMIHTCPSCGLFGRKVRRRERQARRTAEAGLVAWFAALRAAVLQ